MRKLAAVLILALAGTLAHAAGPAVPAPPTFAPSAIFATPSSTQHFNAFAFAASPDSTTATPGTTNLYRASGSCPATVLLTAFAKIQTGNPPSASATAPVYDTNVVAGDVFSYVVTAVIGGKESIPSSCVTGTTPTFSPTSLTTTSN